MPEIDTQYEDLLRDVLTRGTHKPNRTGIDTYDLFGRQLRYDLSRGFPLITTKKMFIKGVVAELVWFLRGDSNVDWLWEQDVHIWDEWADEHGNLGPVYGVQWRAWSNGFKHIDQIDQLVKDLRANPNSRRHIVSAWNVTYLDKMALVPCHYSFQCDVTEGRLSLLVNQRSCDMFLGVPFNIASYALLTHMLAAQTGLAVGDLIWSGGSCHIYDNHLPVVAEQLNRDPRPFPTLKLAQRDSIFEYRIEDVEFENYVHHPALKGAVAV